MGLKKYFIAVVVPEPFLEHIEAIKQWLLKDYGLKGALRSPSHITLHRPFEWKEEKEEVLIQKLSAFRFSKKFEIELQNFDFFEPRVIFVNVVPSHDLLELNECLKNFARRELNLFNEAQDLRGFSPHVTVASRDLKKKLFYELKPEFQKKIYTGIFAYAGFSLLKLESKWEKCFDFKLTTE